MLLSQLLTILGEAVAHMLGVAKLKPTGVFQAALEESRNDYLDSL